MLFFGSKESFESLAILEGMTDWHSHILPWVDDGAKDFEEALAILDFYDRKGVKEVWLTPHIMEDFPNTPAQLHARYNELKERYSGPIKLNLAAEHMLDSLFEERLQNGEVMPIGSRGDHLLVETSYFNPPFGMREMLTATMKAGFTPILAHPERYRYMEFEDYQRLKNAGIKLQVNLMSLIGLYGSQAKKKCCMLLKHNMADLAGSDIHRLAPLLENFNASISDRKELRILKQFIKNANRIDIP